MEIREFSSVEEAIEALDKIENIDYSSVEGISELTEREFYSKLMNNYMGTRNIKFTKEERENYKAALRKKGLLTYREWKAKQPPTEEKMTWAEASEKGTLDAPVNIFSHLLTADNEERFGFIAKVVNDSVLGSMWLDKNRQILENLEKENTEKTEIIEEIVEENNENKPEVTFDLKDDYEFNKEKYSDISNEKEPFKFSTPEEAIEALKSIEKIEYKNGKKIELSKEQDFYSKIMKNLMACGDLKFDDDQSYQYQHALQNLGCKQKSKLNKVRKIDESIALPVEYINEILQSRKADHHQKFKDAKFKVKNNEELNKWLENVENSVEIPEETIEENNQEKSLVPFKKPSLFKRVKAYASLAVAGVATIFGIGKATEQLANQVNEDLNVKKESTDLGVETPDDVLAEKFKDVEFESSSKKDFTEELKDEVNEEAKLEEKETESQIEEQNDVVYEVSIPSYSSGDIKYTKTPDDHAEITGEANQRAEEEKKNAEEAEKEAEEAKKEVEKSEIEFVIPEETAENVIVTPETEKVPEIEDVIIENIEVAPPAQTEFVEVEVTENESQNQDVQVEIETEDEREKVEIEIDF